MTMQAPPGALEGVRVLDLATFIAAPFAATTLAEFGADVVKVELPGIGDPARHFGTMTECGDSLVFLSEARNKRSITVDLRTSRGAEIIRGLVSRFDIVCENFQPGTLEEWGLGYDDLREINPALIMLRISAYGQSGPYRNRPGFGRIANAFGGISYLAGDPAGPPVTPGSATLADYLSGLYGALGILVALRHRDRTGEGQMIDLGLYEPVFRILDEVAPAYGRSGFVRERMGAGTVNVCPHSHYPTADGHWVAIACTNDKMFARLAALMGRSELAGDGPFGTIAARLADRSSVDALVADWSGQLTRAALLGVCEEAQVPCGSVHSIADIFADPQFAARENIIRFADERAGEVALANVVPRLSRTPGSIRSLAPGLGLHTDSILKDELDMTDAEIAELRTIGAI